MRKLFLLGLVVVSIATNAQDRLFTNTYQSNVLSKGQKEIEVWTTLRSGRTNYYRALDNSVEYEIGLGSKLQTAFYLNSKVSTGIEADNGTQSVANETEFSFANEWKLKLSDPVADVIGSAAYFEYKLNTQEVELEGKLIFDKQIGNTIHALNVSGEVAFISELEQNGAVVDVVPGTEYNVNLNYGLSHKLNKNLALGLEIMNNNRYEGSWLYSALFAGPSISYNSQGFWINFSVIPQLTDFSKGSPDLIHNEKFATRLIFSYVF